MSGDHNMHCSGNQPDIATYRINYDLAGWQKIADEQGHLCAPFGAILAVNALCDEVEELRQILRNAYEVYAGSEGIPEPETAAEAYVGYLLNSMKDEIARGLK